MPNIIFLKSDGSEHTIAVENGTTVMEAGRDANLGIEGTCGGCLSCATCHVIVDSLWFAKTGAPSEDEIDMLGDVTNQIAGHTICAFGEGSSWPVQGLLRHFSSEIKKRNKFDPIIKENKDIPYLVDQHLLDKNA